MPEKTDLEKVAELLNVEILPPLDSGDILSLHKALPGYQAIADDAARFVQKHKEILKLDDAVLAGLENGLADVLHLEPAEHLLEKLHLSVYHQRLQATSRCIEGMYGASRRIREFENACPEIKDQAKFLFDFLKAFHPGPKKEKSE